MCYILEEKSIVLRLALIVLGAIRGVLLGERKDKKRSVGFVKGLYFFKEKRRGI